jgi:hypothetical protein
MDALTARSTALDSHPLHQAVLAAIQTAVTASPPQFRCEVDMSSHHESDGIMKALATKLRGDLYHVEYNPQTYMLNIDWCS